MSEQTFHVNKIYRLRCGTLVRFAGFGADSMYAVPLKPVMNGYLPWWCPRWLERACSALGWDPTVWRDINKVWDFDRDGKYPIVNVCTGERMDDWDLMPGPVTEDVAA